MVGYDERSTKKSGLDICTVATKFVTTGSSPDFILVAHETVYNPSSQVSLISEFQVRKHGCVVDSVSKSHCVSIQGDKGTQMFYPHDDLPIQLKLMKGLMGFTICEPNQTDLDQLEHVDITSDTIWQPHLSMDDDIRPNSSLPTYFRVKYW